MRFKMLRGMFHFLVAWLLAALYFFLGCTVIIAALFVGVMFITWSLPDIQQWAELFFGVRVLIAFSVFMGFCWVASPDWDEW